MEHLNWVESISACMDPDNKAIKTLEEIVIRCWMQWLPDRMRVSKLDPVRFVIVCFPFVVVQLTSSISILLMCRLRRDLFLQGIRNLITIHPYKIFANGYGSTVLWTLRW